MSLGQEMMIQEASLRAFWASRLAARGYTSTDGRAVRVKFPGFENDEAGPDFISALIEVEGFELRGDIELHRLESDWQVHGHHCQHEYRNVILHVVLQADGPQARTIDGERVVTISLIQNLGERLPALLEEAEHAKACPCPASPHLDRKKLGQILKELGRERLFRKVSRFRSMLDEHGDLDQLIYEGLAQALGYPKNKGPMLELARRVPFSQTQREPEQARGAAHLRGC